MSVYLSGEVASWYLPHARRTRRRIVAAVKTSGGEVRNAEILEDIFGAAESCCLFLGVLLRWAIC